MSNTLTGRVKWFDSQKGFGFISAKVNGESKEFFVHFSSIRMDGYKTLLGGETVEFDSEPGKDGKGPCAVNVIRVETAVAA